MKPIEKILIIALILVVVNFILILFTRLDDRRNEAYQDCYLKETIDSEYHLICE